MVTLQIVGFKNSGKTTISKKIINYLANKQLKIASLKHHGHGGLPDGFSNTDSEQHKQSGSVLAGVVGEHVLQLSHSEDWQANDIINIYKQFGVDFLLVEGFKNLAYPKLVLLRNEEDASLLSKLENIIGIIKSKDFHLPNNTLPVFNSDDFPQIGEWIYHGYREGKLG
ncbi:molybdopterin-guanine dinucleotide biosynthesis protein B [Ornithinibacillus californiensis]|uniref:molybdopterin-guanine dinucleotide biosynthesis protein B n=1 Tax=Ornithinibacillus californiensis TaxID=161536 RepID=UPI00069CE2C2|nr:molybdopterin-guanine dinucleotide biosynthesis protein B [Ornithinibacillus californiensis]